METAAVAQKAADAKPTITVAVEHVLEGWKNKALQALEHHVILDAVIRQKDALLADIQAAHVTALQDLAAAKDRIKELEAQVEKWLHDAPQPVETVKG